jgi:hypothetical protein
MVISNEKNTYFGLGLITQLTHGPHICFSSQMLLITGMANHKPVLS